MEVPDFIAQDQKSGKRRLVELNQLDVSRDLFELQFVLKSELEPEDIKYYLEIDKWTPKEVRILVNFTDPAMVSKGMERDTIYIKVKNSDMFKSKKTGKSLDMSKAVIKQTIPR